MKKAFAVLALTFGLGFASAQQTKPAKSDKQTIKVMAARDEDSGKPHHTSSESAQSPIKLKADGTPDRRYKQAKHLKKDGTPDKRYKEHK